MWRQGSFCQLGGVINTTLSNDFRRLMLLFDKVEIVDVCFKKQVLGRVRDVGCLLGVFKVFGRVRDVYLSSKKSSKRSSFAFIHFETQEKAKRVVLTVISWKSTDQRFRLIKPTNKRNEGKNIKENRLHGKTPVIGETSIG